MRQNQRRLRAAKEMGAYKVVAVDALGDLMQKKPTGSLVDTILRCFDIMDTRTALHRRRRYKKNVLYLEPALGGMDQYQVKQLSLAYEKGYELGKSRSADLRAFLEETE